MYYKLLISETGRNSLKEDARLFNVFKECFRTIKDLKEHLIDRYGKMPKGKNKIYRDPDRQEVGFLHSFWNSDISHNSKSWYQTDWIEVTKVHEIPILI